MSDALPQRARKRRRAGDHLIVARTLPGQQPDLPRLADAILLHASHQRAVAEGSPVPHLAGMHKLTSTRTRTREEGDND